MNAQKDEDSVMFSPHTKLLVFNYSNFLHSSESQSIEALSVMKEIMFCQFLLSDSVFCI